MIRVLYHSADRDDPAPWQAVLQAQDRDIALVPYEPGLDLAGIDYALVHGPPPGVLDAMPDLRVIFSLFAGVEHLLTLPSLPAVPIVRMASRELTAGMAQYIVLHTLKYYRQLDLYRAAQRAGTWMAPSTHYVPGRVGIFGAGTLGAAAGRALVGLGLDVVGWNRTPKDDAGFPVLAGAAALTDFLARTDILVITLALTAETAGIVDAALLARLPRGACLINAARGAHIDDNALLRALDSGHIAGATLDVFRTEPLPAGHPLWSHPGIELTPHVASVTFATADAARHVVGNIHRDRSGAPLTNVVAMSQGY